MKKNSTKFIRINFYVLIVFILSFFLLSNVIRVNAEVKNDTPKGSYIMAALDLDKPRKMITNNYCKEILIEEVQDGYVLYTMLHDASIMNNYRLKIGDIKLNTVLVDSHLDKDNSNKAEQIYASYINKAQLKSEFTAFMHIVPMGSDVHFNFKIKKIKTPLSATFNNALKMKKPGPEYIEYYINDKQITNGSYYIDDLSKLNIDKISKVVKVNDGKESNISLDKIEYNVEYILSDDSMSNKKYDNNNFDKIKELNFKDMKQIVLKYSIKGVDNSDANMDVVYKVVKNNKFNKLEPNYDDHTFIKDYSKNKFNRKYLFIGLTIGIPVIVIFGILIRIIVLKKKRK